MTFKRKGNGTKDNDHPGQYLRGEHGSQFHTESSAFKPHCCYFDSLFTPTTPPLKLPPTNTSLGPADGGSFVRQHPGNNIKGPLGVNAEWPKNKNKIEKSS